MVKPTIKQVVVVEGKTDTNHLKKLFNVNTIETNGSALNKKTINLIKLAAQNQGVILFLDPDHVGNQIRKKIIQHLDNNYSEAFILKKHWKTKKIGVNEAEDQEIIDALLSAAKTISHHSQSINIEQYNSLNLNSYAIRMKLCDKLKIPYCNHKQLFKRLNMLNINLKELKKIINNLK